MIENNQWFVVYTHPRREKKVAENLARKGIDNYCPLNRVMRQWKDRKKIVLEPLFTSYVFVHAQASDSVSILQTEGIINFVYWLGKPVTVRPSEIHAIRRFLNEYEEVRLEKTFVNVNDSVRIIRGPLVDQEGQIVTIKNKTVKVLLPTLGYTMVVEVSRDNVELLQPELRNVS